MELSRGSKSVIYIFIFNMVVRFILKKKKKFDLFQYLYIVIRRLA